MRFVGLIAIPTLLLGAVSPVAAATEPIPKRGSSAGDYPTSALFKHHEGTTYVTVTVANDGRPRDCFVTKSSGWPELDQATCKNMLKRVRFTPATDDDGTPIEAPFSTHADWRIPP